LLHFFVPENLVEKSNSSEVEMKEKEGGGGCLCLQPAAEGSKHGERDRRAHSPVTGKGLLATGSTWGEGAINNQPGARSLCLACGSFSPQSGEFDNPHLCDASIAPRWGGPLHILVGKQLLPQIVLCRHFTQGPRSSRVVGLLSKHSPTRRIFPMEDFWICLIDSALRGSSFPRSQTAIILPAAILRQDSTRGSSRLLFFPPSEAGASPSLFPSRPLGQ
jgi:hypothetical protein